jgi:hypothetical protein
MISGLTQTAPESSTEASCIFNDHSSGSAGIVPSSRNSRSLPISQRPPSASNLFTPPRTSRADPAFDDPKARGSFRTIAFEKDEFRRVMTSASPGDVFAEAAGERIVRTEKYRSWQLYKLQLRQSRKLPLDRSERLRSEIPRKSFVTRHTTT